MSDTPETNAEIAALGFGFYTMRGFPADAVKIEFARKLERERDEARELAANLEISLTAAIRSANVRQDETEHAMHECSELRILVDGLSEMTHELSEDRNLWKTEAEKWRDIAYGNRN